MNDSVIERYRTLVELLYKRTVQHKIKWESASYSGSYTVQIGSNALHLSTREGRDDQPDMIVSIYNNDGVRVDGFSDEDISSESPRISDFSNYWGMMRDIYWKASRQALRADEVLDDVMAKLNSE